MKVLADITSFPHGKVTKSPNRFGQLQQPSGLAELAKTYTIVTSPSNWANQKSLSHAMLDLNGSFWLSATPPRVQLPRIVGGTTTSTAHQHRRLYNTIPTLRLPVVTSDSRCLTVLHVVLGLPVLVTPATETVADRSASSVAWVL